MKKIILFSTVVLLAFLSVSYAQETQSTQMKVTFDLKYSSKYVWRGFNVYGNKSAIHPTLDLFCPVSNVGFSVEGHRANSSGYEINERWDYSLYYLGKAFQDEQFEMMYRLAYVYYNYPDLSSHTAYKNTQDIGSLDLQEIHAALSFPKLLGIDGLVPSYVLVKLWPSNSGTIVGAKSPSGGTASGFAHIFMLDYSLPFICPITGVDRKLNLHAEAVYNDGVAPDGGNTLVHGRFRGPADHDWSNAVFGASTIYDLNSNISFTPGLYYQASFDDTVNNEDQVWGTLSMTCKF